MQKGICFLNLIKIRGKVDFNINSLLLQLHWKCSTCINHAVTHLGKYNSYYILGFPMERSQQRLKSYREEGKIVHSQYWKKEKAIDHEHSTCKFCFNISFRACDLLPNSSSFVKRVSSLSSDSAFAFQSRPNPSPRSQPCRPSKVKALVFFYLVLNLWKSLCISC
jgi:hypothetical protein